MSEPQAGSSGRAPWHLWAIGIVGVLWNTIGTVDYKMTQTHNEAYLSAVSPQQLEFIYGVPAWAVAAFAGMIVVIAAGLWWYARRMGALGDLGQPLTRCPLSLRGGRQLHFNTGRPTCGTSMPT